MNEVSFNLTLVVTLIISADQPFGIVVCSTLESIITKYQNSRNTNKYVDVLDDIVHNYNHTFHQSIQDIPERKFLMNPNSGVVLTNHFKFLNDIQVGDYVRILKEKKNSSRKDMLTTLVDKSTM